MSGTNLWQRALVFSAVLLLLASGVAFGQATGNLYVQITDTEGGALPGVTVTVTGIGAPRTQIANDQGAARFLGLDPGQYIISGQLDGFGSVEYPGVSVAVGRNTAITLELQPAIEETITVTSESPLLDERKLSTGTNITQVELEKIPSARDPWAMLSQTPGVQVDRINVGGSESGQQSGFRAAGVSDTQNDFMMDGVSITDMAAAGASPTYYDFDQFAEMSFTTGGTDVSKNSAGVQVNLITKRGSNEFRGSARFYNEDAGGYFGGALKQSQADLTSELNTANGQTSLTGAQIRGIEDLGFEAGGAVVKDRFWLWGSWGQQDIKQNAASGVPDDTILENTSLKANGQISAANSAVASFNNGDKLKFGRGASTTRPRPTTWNQRGPSAVYRVEDTHVFGSNFFLTGTYSHGDFGFALLAIGQSGDGLAGSESDPRLDTAGVWQDNFQSGSSSRPYDEFKADTSYFFNSGNLSHEVKVGGRLRQFEQNSDFSWGPRDTFADESENQIIYHRGSTGVANADYFSLWAQDTMSLGKATINVGLRYDQQDGSTEPFNRPAHPTRPDIFPQLNFAGGGSGFSWESIVPRVGVTYALGQERSTLLRATFAQFADSMESSLITASSPFGSVYAYTDATTGEFISASGFDPNNPLEVANRINPRMDAPVTSEILLGAEHALLPEFVIGFTLTYRNVTDILDTNRANNIGRNMVVDENGVTRVAVGADYVQVDTLTGNLPRGAGSYNVPVYDLRPGVNATGGTYFTNGARERNYTGATFNFTKRLANRWMARGYVTVGDAEWDVPAQYFIDNEPTNYRGGGSRDGDLYLTRSSGSGKGERFLQSSWNYNLTGMYQVAPDRPWGFNVSASVDGREGFPIPYYDQVSTSYGNQNLNLVGDFDNIRLDDLFIANLRVEKEFNLTGPVNMTFGIDMFNVTNENTGLSYQTRADVSSAGNLQDNISPRIYRLGVRLSWK